MSSAQRLQQISFNLPVDAKLRAGIERYNQGRMMHGDHYVTVVKPEYRQQFQGAILHLMNGLVVANVGPATLPDERVVTASIFGFTANFVRISETSLIVPNIDTAFVSNFDDPMGAIHSFHQGLVYGTNAALEQLEVPFRLASVPEV